MRNAAIVGRMNAIKTLRLYEYEYEAARPEKRRIRALPAP